MKTNMAALLLLFLIITTASRVQCEGNIIKLISDAVVKWHNKADSGEKINLIEPALTQDTNDIKLNLQKPLQDTKTNTNDIKDLATLTNNIKEVTTQEGKQDTGEPTTVQDVVKQTHISEVNNDIKPSENEVKDVSKKVRTV